jgi:hypothetical protein
VNLTIRFELGLLGVDDAEIAEMDAALPAAIRLDEAVTELDPIIRKIWPDVLQIMAIVQKEYSDAMAVLPVGRKLLVLAKGT